MKILVSDWLLTELTNAALKLQGELPKNASLSLSSSACTRPHLHIKHQHRQTRRRNSTIACYSTRYAHTGCFIFVAIKLLLTRQTSPIMASAADLDGLVLLRQSISSKASFIPRASADVSADASAPEVPLSQATHLCFPDRSVAVPIDSPTRFVSHDKPVDLRSIYFAWLNREVAIPEYNASATKLNDELAAAGGAGKVQNLGFIERLDLITWLEGASEESEYIKPVAGDKDAAAAGATTTAKTGAVSSAAQARSGRGTMDPRLAGIYNGERRMGDRNTVLRGIKPTVCVSLIL